MGGLPRVLSSAGNPDEGSGGYSPTQSAQIVTAQFGEQSFIRDAEFFGGGALAPFALAQRGFKVGALVGIRGCFGLARRCGCVRTARPSCRSQLDFEREQ